MMRMKTGTVLFASWLVAAFILAAQARGAAAPVVNPDGVIGPPWFQQNLVYYNSFDPHLPPYNPTGLRETDHGATAPVAAGAFGPGLLIHSLLLDGPAVSPARPITLSFWWALPHDLPIDGGFGLFAWHGKGLISAFCHGKGEWCALQRPAGVLQVYYLAGIQNVNDIYDLDLAAHLDLRARAWHHCAVVIRNATDVQLFADGKEVARITVSGRPFAPADNLTQVEIGSDGGDGILIDELAILDRAVDADLIRDYWAGAEHLRR